MAYTVDEAAKHYKVSRRRVRDWIKDGRLEAVKRGGVWFVMKGQPYPKDRRTKPKQQPEAP